MRDVTFEQLQSMTRAEAEGGLGVVPERYREFWRIYRGEQWRPDELAVFKAAETFPFALNEIAALIDTYCAKLDPKSLEPVVEAEDGESAPYQEVATAFLAKARKNSRVAKVEKEIPKHQFVQGVTGVFCSVYSDNGRIRHRVEILQPEEIHFDSRSMLPNAQDSMWRAFVRGYTAREIKLEMPDIWRKLKSEHMTEEGTLDEVITTPQGLFNRASSRGSRRTSFVEICWIEWKEHRSYLMIPNAVLTDYDKAVAHELGLEITVDGLRLEADEVEDFEDAMASYQQDAQVDERSTRWSGEVYRYAVVAGSKVVEQGELLEGCFRIILACGPPVKLETNAVTYRSLVDDNYGAQNLLNHTVTGMIVAAGRGVKGLHILPEGEETAAFELNGARPGAAVKFKEPERHKYLPSDGSVLVPMMGIADLAKRSMQTRMGTSDFSQGRIPEGDKLTRTSSKALENLLSNADAPVKAYYEAFIEFRLELGMCMLRQITHWSFEDLAKMLGLELIAPLAQGLYPQTSIPSGALWQLEIDLREPQKETDAQVAAAIIGQGVLMQLGQLGAGLPPELVKEVVAPLFGTLSKSQLEQWSAHIQQQMAAMQAPPPEEVPN